MRKLIIILLFIPQILFAQTRFYVSSTNATVSPATDASWTTTTGFDRKKMLVTKDAAAMANKTTATASGVDYMLNRMFVSEPLAAQTITGTISGQIRSLATPFATGFEVIAVVVRVVNNAGTTYRGTLLSMYSNFSNGLNSSLRNINFPDAQSVSSVAAQDGDRVVIEVGFYNAAGAPNACTQSFGSDSGTDLPVNNTTTAANNPWFQFSMTLTFQGGGAPANRGMPLFMMQ